MGVIFGGPCNNDTSGTCLLGSSDDIFGGPCNNDTSGTCILGSSDDDYCGVACIFGGPCNNDTCGTCLLGSSDDDIWQTRLLSRARLHGGTNLRGIRCDVSPSDYRTWRIHYDVSTNLRGIRCDVSNVWGLRRIHYDVSRACLFCTWRIRYDASNVWPIFFLCLDDLVRLASALADAMAHVFATMISLLFWGLLRGQMFFTAKLPARAAFGWLVVMC